MNKLETIFSTSLFPIYENEIESKNVVIIDVLRATSTIVWALEQGASFIRPVKTFNEALELKTDGYIAAAERNGVKIDFADLGNSPFEYVKAEIENKKIAFTTTNGTLACILASKAKQVVIGSFLNIQAVISFINKANNDTLLFCSGWKGKFNLEDSLLAGAIASEINNAEFDDATLAAIDLWNCAKMDIYGYLNKASHVKRFTRLGNENDLTFCTQLNVSTKLPIYKNGIIQ